ncbi:hypothetical protein FK515_30825, partial [Klebsiella pneumoniae]|nr:hypothetical protein [Klebsiella pneumoniae]
ARTGCEHFHDLQKLSLCISEILTRDSETDRPGVPFCDFADAGKIKMQQMLFLFIPILCAVFKRGRKTNLYTVF